MLQTASTTVTAPQYRRILVLAFVGLLAAILLAGCGSQDSFTGTWYAQTSTGDYAQLVINKDGSATYQENGDDTYQGTWTRADNSLLLDFGGEVGSECEPLIAYQSEDGDTLILSSNSKHWNDDYYHRMGK